MRYSSVPFIFLGLLLVGCASTAPLPATFNIVPPSSDVSTELAAFSGIWDGRWWNGLESILIVEKIDNQKAELIISSGIFQGYAPSYFYHTADVTASNTIEWTEPNGDRIIFRMDKGLNKILGVIIEKKTGANLRLYLSRRKAQ